MSKHIITDDDLLELQNFLKRTDSSEADYLYNKLEVARNATFERTDKSLAAPDNLSILFSLSESIGNGLITMKQLSDYNKNLIEIVHNLSADFKNISKEEDSVNEDLIERGNLLRKFCTNEILHFGSEDSGLEIIATAFKDETEFLETAKKMLDYDDYAEDDVSTINIYFLKENEIIYGTGFFAKSLSGTLPDDAIYIGQFFGIEY